MVKALETFHHALGTVECGADLPDDHPIVVAVPHLFDIAPTVPAERPVKAAKASKG